MKPLLTLCLGLVVSGAMAGLPSREVPLPPFSVLLEGADSLVVYEGLPHRGFDRAAYAQEKTDKQVFRVSGEFFYEKLLPVTDADRQALDRLFRGQDPCAPYRAGKLCGGFHADYMIEWRKGDEPLTRVLVCFGCREFIVVGGPFNRRTDITPAGVEALRSLLAHYRQERPAAQSAEARGAP